MKSTKSLSEKLLGIELLRFFASLSILIWHFQHFSIFSKDEFVKTEQPFYEYLALFYDHGDWGVQLFWCVSGFIFFYNYQNSIRNRTVSTLRFSINRFSRLYPLHFFTLILVFILQYYYVGIFGEYFVYIHNDFKHFFLNLMLINEWGLQEGFSYNGPIWSVSLELIAYLLFFIAAKNFNLFKAIVFLILSTIIAKALGAHDLSSCLKYFAFGGVIFFILNYLQNKAEDPALLNLFLLTISVVGLIFTNQIESRSLFVLSIVLFSIIVGPFFQKLERICVNLGNLTYSSYLLHFPIQIALALTYNGVIAYSDEKLFLYYLSITFLLAYLTFHFFERPTQKYLRKKFIT